MSLKSKQSKRVSQKKPRRKMLKGERKKRGCQSHVIKAWRTFQHGRDHSCQFLIKSIDVKRNFTFLCVLSGRSAARIYLREYIWLTGVTQRLIQHRYTLRPLATSLVHFHIGKMKIDLTLLCLTGLQRLSRYQITLLLTRVHSKQALFLGVEKLLEGREAEQVGAPTKTFHSAHITAASPSQRRRAVTHPRLSLLWS